MIFVENILDKNLKSYSHDILLPIIDDIYKTNPFEVLEKIPSTRSVQRWIKRYRDANGSIRGLLDYSESQGNRKKKIDPRLEPCIEKAIAHFKSRVQPTIAKSYEKIKIAVNEINKEITNKLKN